MFSPDSSARPRRGSLTRFVGLGIVSALAILIVGVSSVKAANLPATVSTSSLVDEGFTPLFNGKDTTGWTVYLDPKAKAKPEEIFSVKDGVIACKGTVNGYLITEDEYSDYVLRLKWRWGKGIARGRNSGVFVHVVGDNKIWPKGVEAQLMADHAGDFWLVNGYKLDINPEQKDPGTDRHYYRTVKGAVEKPVGEWNQYEIRCEGDTVTLMINGKVVNVGKKAEIPKGKILLQSEGAAIDFKDIEIKPLKK